MPASSKITAGLALFRLLTLTNCAYTLQDDYSGSSFFEKFSFFTETDPTNGYVDYISQSAAQSAGLINTNNNQVFMGVDSTNIASGRGRKSVRVTSKASYNHGLIILDLAHFPANACGIWPAFWTVGPNWPSNGEIDIIEGVNYQDHNSVALHTGPGCSISSHGSLSKRTSANPAQVFSGVVNTANCDVKASGQAENAGCSIASRDKSSYGDGFNQIQGGVYATEWTSNAISVWFFPRGSIPSDIDSSPDPSSWGTPMAAFHSTSCDIDSKFRDQQIVFDTTFCGDWAGNVFSSDSTCSSKGSSCEDYVKNNPEAFTNAYWTINSLKVFTGSSSGGNGTVPSVSRPLPSGTGRPGVSSAPGWSVVPSVPSVPAATQSLPCVPPLCSPEVTSKPGVTATTNAAEQGWPTQPGGWPAQPDWQSHPGWGGGRWSHHGRDVAPATTATAVTLPPPVRRTVDDSVVTDRRARRHLAEHRRHGSRFLA